MRRKSEGALGETRREIEGTTVQARREVKPKQAMVQPKQAKAPSTDKLECKELQATEESM